VGEKEVLSLLLIHPSKVFHQSVTFLSYAHPRESDGKLGEEGNYHNGKV
jgi:hypothetical protein